MTYFKKDIPGLTTHCHFPTSYKHDIVLIPNQDAFLSVLEDSAAICTVVQIANCACLARWN